MNVSTHETFGYRLSSHRVAKNMTEATLAEELNCAPESEHITEQHVKDWEMMRAAPDEQTFESLCEILIDESVAVDEKMKPVARENFRRAYDVLRQALEKGNLEEVMSPGVVMFGNLLRHHRERSNLSEQHLAEMLSDAQSNEHITPQHIVNYQHGLAKPSLRHTRRMADVFELDTEQRGEFYEAHRVTKVNLDCGEFDQRRDAIVSDIRSAGINRRYHNKLSYKRPVESQIEAIEETMISYKQLAHTPEQDDEKQKAMREKWDGIVDRIRELHEDYKGALERAGGSISQHMRAA